LFGYEKGSFTGAQVAQAGKFEQAQGGTLLLDEISEMPLALQAKLLRVLQEREVERVGGRKAIALDIRVLATSNRDMAAEVAAGRFREDLFYRLNVFPLQIPPLRERPGDILPLARHFLARHAATIRRLARLDSAAEALLQNHPWPGNVRELENTMQRALILAPGDVIDAATLALCLPTAALEGLPPLPAAMPASFAAAPAARPDNMKDLEREHILATLREVNGSRKLAVERLGISERTLRYKLQQYRDEGHDV
ncbi:MAG: sigma 54-interacting transcriptional regulator, partial [Pseudazoarcus pumilus]|nr:sigma 54-interacting transcriptional regulator [Pseudazoarcus pumilus]